MDCSNLTDITIPDKVTSIGIGVFAGCSSLTSITVASGNPVYHGIDNCLIETASKTLVSGCKNSVIPTDGSVTSIGDEAFSGCSGLTSITIPDSVTSIGDYAFRNCSSLTSIEIPDGGTSIGYMAFYHCRSLTSIAIPDSVTSIGKWAFAGCDNLAYVTLEDPDGWYCASREGATSGTELASSDLSDSSTAARYLRDYYDDYYWYKR